jgi:hypothetical protein
MSKVTNGKSTTGRIALVAGSLVVALIILEIGCRLLTLGPASLLHWTNLARLQMSEGDSESEARAACNYTWDAELGWSLPPDCRTPGYDTDADGNRVVPLPPDKAGTTLALPPILATGASFAFGIEVADGETWPAYLQALSGRAVVNAGMSGYSLDQTVLQTERMAARVKPLVIVASFTPGDPGRNELKVAYSRAKPYFALTRDGLELKNVPVPRRTRPPLPLAARWLGWSALAHEVVERMSIRDGWYYEEERATPPGSGIEISCRLMPRLAKLGAPVLVVAQFGRNYWGGDPAWQASQYAASARVLACAKKAGLATLDLSGPLKPLIEAKGLDALYGRDHHTPAGNKVVADLILQELLSRHLLSQSAAN